MTSMTNDSKLSAEGALSAELLATYMSIADTLLVTPSARAEAAKTYHIRARSAHPAVAQVLREAAGIVERM